jgi:hypothetical protein
MRSWMMLACMAIAMLATVHASAAAVRVVGTWPAGSAVTLHPHQKFYLHLHYTSDAPVQIWAEAYYRGKPADAGNNPSGTWPAGEGEAIGWFFLSNPNVRVDEVRIRAGDGSPKGTPVVASYPVTVDGSAAPAPATARPEWVTRQMARAKALERAQQARFTEANSSSSGGDALFFVAVLAMLAMGVLGFLAPAWGLWRWRGGWRVAAMVPLAVMVFVVLRLVTGVAIDPTSHNLWPFELVMWGGLSCVWMLVAALAHKLAHAGGKA